MKNYFPEKDMACKCCGVSKMQPSTIEKLNKAREIAGFPFKINSAYRCEKHNKAIGSNSIVHPLGYAADISCTESRKRFIIIDALLKAGFRRIGVHKQFIHADDCPTRDQDVVWFY
jgi:hypothetical protein